MKTLRKTHILNPQLVKPIKNTTGKHIFWVPNTHIPLKTLRKTHVLSPQLSEKCLPCEQYPFPAQRKTYILSLQPSHIIENLKENKSLNPAGIAPTTITLYALKAVAFYYHHTAALISTTWAKTSIPFSTTPTTNSRPGNAAKTQWPPREEVHTNLQ